MIRAVLARVLLGVLAGTATASAALAQDLAGAAPVGSGGVFEMLERALPAEAPGVTAAAASTRWWGLRELETRSLALGGGWRAVRVAFGLSQTGVPELGWTTLALAVGGAGPGAGTALRVIARRDRDAPWSVAYAVAPAAGLEVGAGAWLTPLANVRVWASAPQIFARGEAPPLVRPLELGVRAGDATAVWCTLRAPNAGDDGERALGTSLGVTPLVAWAEVRDAPLRGSAGIRAGAGPLAANLRVDAHPALGETIRLAIEWRAGLRDSP